MKISSNLSYSDYFPFGLPYNDENTETWRHTYQGDFAEKDEETGWNAFQLRMYDARIGRWLSVDPEAQYHSLYMANGNNPVSTIDPTGGYNPDIVVVNNKDQEIGRIVLPGEDHYVTIDTDLELPEPIVYDPGNLDNPNIQAVGIHFEYSGALGGGLTFSADVVHFTGDNPINALYVSAFGGKVGYDIGISAQAFESSFNWEAGEEFYSVENYGGKFNSYGAGTPIPLLNVSYTWSNTLNSWEKYPGEKGITTWETWSIGESYGPKIQGSWGAGNNKLVTTF